MDRPALDPERLDRAPRHLDGRLGVRRRPRLRERHAERMRNSVRAVADRERDQLAVHDEAADGGLRPVDVLLDHDGAAARARAGRLDRARQLRRRRARVQARLPPWRSGALTTQGGPSSPASPPTTTSQRGCGTPAAASRSRWRSLLVSTTAVAGATGCARPSFSATRAATPTDLSEPGAITPSSPSADASRSIAGSSSIETMQRRAAKPESGRGRVAVADRRPDPARPRGLEQAQLCRAGSENEKARAWLAPFLRHRDPLSRWRRMAAARRDRYAESSSATSASTATSRRLRLIAKAASEPPSTTTAPIRPRAPCRR